MAMALPIPRVHFFEIDDQIWFPQLLREKVQACLALCWRLRLPIIQPASPATLAASALQKYLSSALASYTFVDFCAGAGGPTPSIEREVNEALRESGNRHDSVSNDLSEGNWMSKKSKKQNTIQTSSGVDFVMTDLFPNAPAWSKAAKRSENIHYVAESVDAANAPSDLLAKAGLLGRKTSPQKIFRLYNLAFHHFPDRLAEAILLNTLSTSDGFAIFELQGRDLGNFITVFCIAPLLWAGSWYWFWGDWWHLFFTYVVPVIPAVVVFDGLISCLRTRREGEVKEMVRRVVAAKEREEPGTGGQLLDGWRFEAGTELHTWPGGTMQYFVGIKNQ